MGLIETLPEDKLLIQFAEECCEAGQAAMKLLRAVNGDTPVSETEARHHLLEEMADVKVCMLALMDEPSKIMCDWICQQKIKRWEQRLAEGRQNANK